MKSVYCSNIPFSGINACLSIVSADPVWTSGRDMFPGESSDVGPAMFLVTRVLLRKTFDEVQKLAPTENTATGRVDEDDLEHLMSFANSQLEFLEFWRSVLPSHLAWEDKELPSTDPLMASLRAEYYNSRVKLLRPYLRIIRNCECFNVAVDRPPAGQRKLFGVALDWINSALSSTIAFDRIGTSYDGVYETYRTACRSSVMLSNPVETLHAQVTSPVKCFFETNAYQGIREHHYPWSYIFLRNLSVVSRTDTTHRDEPEYPSAPRNG
jgi:hypothetical protein